MIIKAKFPSRCEVCGEDIAEGDDIWWERGTNAVHVQCHESQEENTKSPVKPVQPGVTARYRPPPSKIHSPPWT